MSQKPSVGRIVHYTPYTEGVQTQDVIWAALITAVSQKGEVSLAIFPPFSPPFGAGSFVPEGKPGQCGTWHWPERV